MRISTGPALAAFLLGSLPAHAAGPDMATLDGDGDGRVTWAEAKEVRRRQFRDLDADGDGAVGKQEFEARVQRFSDFDRDASDAISQDEFLARHEAMFTLFDTDADGTLTSGELADARNVLERQQAADAATDDPTDPAVSDKAQ